ncbi:MAG TPA: DUF2283 domain-containing protein [Candidatus Nanoarchaeia archaeon]|nr:DUF2283 domain-containing protein [Candidatus Nanoarchaeia archaeon]
MAEHISYDEENDILAVHKGFSSDERFKGNIDAGDLILDVSTKGRVRGIEILNATKFFKEFGIGKEMLENIEHAHFNANLKPDCIILGIVIKAKNVEKEMPAKVAVPLEVAVCC